MAIDQITDRPTAPSYANGGAVQEARLAGLDLRRDDWRDVVLAITDTMATDGQLSDRNGQLTATYVGPVRDGERWSVTVRGMRFDVLYSPELAQIYRMARPTDQAGALAPTAPRKPLVATV